MLDFVIDVQVIMIGSGTGQPKNLEKPCYEFMQKALNREDFHLALDSRSKIRRQYDKKLGSDTFGQYWLRELVDRDRLVVVPWKNLSKKSVKKLKEAHFDSGAGEDYKYVVTAAGTSTRILVSYDKDYSARVRRVLKRTHEIRVCGVEALE